MSGDSPDSPGVREGHDEQRDEWCDDDHSTYSVLLDDLLQPLNAPMGYPDRDEIDEMVERHATSGADDAESDAAGGEDGGDGEAGDDGGEDEDGAGDEPPPGYGTDAEPTVAADAPAASQLVRGVDADTDALATVLEDLAAGIREGAVPVKRLESSYETDPELPIRVAVTAEVALPVGQRDLLDVLMRAHAGPRYEAVGEQAAADADHAGDD